MWQATALALYSGQRQGDVLEMTWASVKGGLLEVRQEKTVRTLVIPAHQGLLSVLSEVPAVVALAFSPTRRPALDQERLSGQLAEGPEGPVSRRSEKQGWCSTVFANRPS